LPVSFFVYLRKKEGVVDPTVDLFNFLL